MSAMDPLGPPSVYERFARPPAEEVAAMQGRSASTVHEANRRLGFMRGIHPRVEGAYACGPAVTSLDHAGDNIMIHAALETCRPGDVLVVACKAPSDHGMFGDLLGELSRALGLAGVVIDAGVRDVADLRKMGVPVWSKAIASDGTAKSNPGWVNVPVVCGGQLVRPGDMIVADDDGVVVVPREQVGAVAQAAAEREAKEAASRERFARGELSLDVGGFREVIAKLGVAYPDREGDA